MNILIVEDNKKLAENTAKVLEHEGYIADTAHTGKEGLNLGSTNNYDLIILDLGLPDIDGLEVCTKLRANEVSQPILMLTARISISDKVSGLDTGADDYLTKPFLMEELLARVRSLLRRTATQKSATLNLGKDDSIKFNTKSKQLTISGKKTSLTPTEIRLFEFLAINKGKVQDAATIYESVWGSTSSDDMLFSDSLKVHVARLRKKLGKDTIKNVKGFGYIIE